MKFKFLVPVLACWAVFLSGCSTNSALLPVSQIPAGNDQEIKVEKTYDDAYLEVFDALNALSTWAPDLTSKDDGLIRLWNKQFGRIDDSSARIVNVRIRRDDAQHTSVFLDPDSRRVIGADEVLAAVRKKFGIS